MNLVEFRKPSRYIDSEINVIKKKDAAIRVALLFPDLYEIGMSHLGLKILYHIINNIPYASAERVFAPGRDLRDYMRKEGMRLASLETNTPLHQFDIVGISLQYELSYTTVLEMLDLGGIAPFRSDRDGTAPIVIAGGPSASNPLPLEGFVDAFCIGDAEEAVVELLDAFLALRGSSREEILRGISGIEGFYVPGYSTGRVRRRYIDDLDSAPYPTRPVVPYTQIVHDRINIELSRGCTRGCRFCQAGMIYRPLRERSPRTVLNIARQSIDSTGYDEVSLTSLSAGDYTQLLPLLRAFNREFSDRKISLSLPSIRVGAVNQELLKEIKSVRKSGFTIAPEAGSERLRRIINKEFSEEEFEKALWMLFNEGWLNVKLYFMVGLPGERDEDVEGIAMMAARARKIARTVTRKGVNITVSVSPFVPKPHTPFQWVGQCNEDLLLHRLALIRKNMPKQVKFKHHDLKMSLIEAALSRGDGRLSDLLYEVWREGAYLEGWSDEFDYNCWLKAMDRTGIDIRGYALRDYPSDESLPWDFIDNGVKKEFLEKEYNTALRARVTADCNVVRCQGCGLGCKSGQYLSADNIGFIPPQREGPSRFKPVKVRMEYSKLGEMRYLSHLELSAAMLRAFRRAGVPLCYTEGFHPMPKVSFGPPLSVGVEGQREYLDVEVYPPFDITLYHERINRELPEGIRINRMGFFFRRLPSISSFVSMYEYEIGLPDGERRLNLRDRTFSDFIEKFDIINKNTVIIQLKDLKDRKVRLKDCLEGIFGVPVEGLKVRRRALYGWKKGWITPMDLIDMKS